MKFAKIKPVKSPQRAHPHDAGIDFFVPENFITTHIPPKGHVVIESGIKLKIPTGYALIFFNKSGVAVNSQLAVGACVVDETYQGELHLHLYNTGHHITLVSPNQKIAQGILIKMFYDEVEEVSEDMLFSNKTKRGEGRFGSTD